MTSLAQFVDIRIGVLSTREKNHQQKNTTTTTTKKKDFVVTYHQMGFGSFLSHFGNLIIV